MAKIGIDFGTTNSLIVSYDKRKGFEYFNFDGRNPVPTSSTIMYHDGEKIIGNEAREKMYRYDGIEGYHFEKSIKLRLGSDYVSNVFGDAVEPYVIASDILSYLKNEAITRWKAEETGVDLKKAVFTVPINFSGKARHELRKAANEAGIEVTTFIHEPFAAIVGHYFSQDKKCDEIISELMKLDGQYVLVFDWGGGTLDITVVYIKDGKMNEMGTSELTKMAGDKFDEDIARYVWNKFCDNYSTRYPKEFLESVRKRRWGRMLAISEKCKIELSKSNSAEFLMESVTGDDNVDIDLTITREDFEKIISSVILKALNKVDDALSQASIQDINISHVLLTGGSCYIPAIQNAMIKKFGHRVESVTNADLLIAQGAAVISELGWLPYLTKDILIELANDSFWPMFDHGSPIAAGKETSVKEMLTCVDSTQDRAKVVIWEGMQQQADKRLGVINVPLLNHRRWGDDVEIEGIINQDIILTVKARSLMVHDSSKAGDYSERRILDINQLCFGLDING